MGCDINLVNNTLEIKAALNEQTLKALEMCGMAAEGYAKLLCPVDKGTLRNSIAHQVIPNAGECYVGSNVEYAPYVEFGTGIYYEGGRRTSWTYQDDNGDWHMTNGQKPQPFIKPSVADHISEYQQIMDNALRDK